jgi:hypothetical protein
MIITSLYVKKSQTICASADDIRNSLKYTEEEEEEKFIYNNKEYLHKLYTK